MESVSELGVGRAEMILIYLQEKGVDVIVTVTGLISCNSCRRQTASCAPKDKTLYSLSVEESEMRFCFLEHHDTAL